MDSRRTFKMKIHGNDYGVEIKKVGEGVASVEVNGTVYQVEFESARKVSKTPTLTRAPVYTTETERPKKTASPTEGAGKTIKSPLPGVILEVKVREGDSIKAGDVLLIMEAMKMENNIVAHSDGTIASLKVGKGDNVLEGDPLVEIGA
jgi:glutaconyl-CoA/methylmalonyl-CoA decarboxylase subunit gamma